MTIRCNRCLKAVDIYGRSEQPDDPNPLFCYFNDGSFPNYPEPDVHLVCCTGSVGSSPSSGDHHATCPNRDRPQPDDEFYRQLDNMYHRHSAVHPQILERCRHELVNWTRKDA